MSNYSRICSLSQFMSYICRGVVGVQDEVIKQMLSGDRDRNMIRLGLFLVDRGRITADQLVEAMRKQFAVRAPLGEIAIKQGFLTVKQVFHVLGKQADSRRLFGETAVQLGYLTEKQLAQIIAEQLDGHPALLDILVDLDLLTSRVAREELESYRLLMFKHTASLEEESPRHQTPEAALV